MPYLSHFGLAEHPFTLTPNTSQFFSSKEHLEIFDALCCGIERNNGIFKVIGEIGTGKTMLCQLFLRKFINNNCIAYINAPQASVNHLLEDLCLEFGIKTSPYYSPLTALRDFMIENHGKGRRVILVIDEAQALNADGLETIRLLSNLETEKTPLLQIILFGQPELDKMLNKKNLRQLKQRIVFSFKTRPLSHENAINYIKHRVECCKSPTHGSNESIFNQCALNLIAKSSHGTTRVINILADKAMLTAYGENETKITAKHVEYAIDETKGIADPVWLERSSAKTILKIAATITLIISLGVLSQTKEFQTSLTSSRLHVSKTIVALGKTIAGKEAFKTIDTDSMQTETATHEQNAKKIAPSGLKLLGNADLSIANLDPKDFAPETGNDFSPKQAIFPKTFQQAKIPSPAPAPVIIEKIEEPKPKEPKKFKYLKNAKQAFGTNIMPKLPNREREDVPSIKSKTFFINKTDEALKDTKTKKESLNKEVKSEEIKTEKVEIKNSEKETAVTEINVKTSATNTEAKTNTKKEAEKEKSPIKETNFYETIDRRATNEH